MSGNFDVDLFIVLVLEVKGDIIDVFVLLRVSLV